VVADTTLIAYTRQVRFEWDPVKAARNAATHGVTFEEATEVFAPGAVVYETYDAEHSESEDRFRTLGLIRRGLALVVWTECAEDVVRIISARFATQAEQELYNEYAGG